MAVRQVTPYLQAMSKYAVVQQGSKEALGWELYDYQAYAAAGVANSQIFFQVPAGQAAKTYADTNMELAGQLSAGEDFLVEAIELDFQPGTLPSVYGEYATNTFVNANDVYDFAYSGWLEFWIQSKRFLLDGPFHRFPCTTGMSLFAATSGVLEHNVDYAKLGGRQYELRSPQMINESQKFKVILNAGAALSSGVAGTCGVRLIGTLYRPVQ